ncbi:MAG: NifU N-terminal domain-containing protein [Actinobacteria bacterium]|nr:NifU N-terminal domain-containing protein [Actinomycetota bacterium]
MGQPVVVVKKPSSKPGVVRFEINRSLTGMGHERYRSVADAGGDRPPDVLARRVLEHGGVAAVHIYSNMITVELTDDGTATGLQELIEDLFIHYREGVRPSIP